MRALLVICAVVALACAGAGARERSLSEGPGWSGNEPSGHLDLARHLDGQATVKPIEATLALLPAPVGADAVFLFPASLPNPGEPRAVRAFVERGGTAILAADGGAAQAWVEALGGSLNGLPILLPADAVPNRCVDAFFDVQGDLRTACLPSPSVLAEADSSTSRVIGRLASPAALDLDEDGEVGLGDQGADTYAVARQWPLGSGQVVLVADAQVWTNSAVRQHPENLGLASALANQASTIYLDATAAGGPATFAARTSLTAALAQPASVDGFALLLPLGALTAALVMQRRHAPWTPHAQDLAKADPDLEVAAHHALLASLPKNQP